MHAMVHALVASLYETPALNSNEVSFSFERLEQEVECGISYLGPVFYRGQECSFAGLTNSGVLVLGEPHLECEDPNELRWSNIQVSVEDLVD